MFPVNTRDYGGSLQSTNKLQGKIKCIFLKLDNKDIKKYSEQKEHLIFKKLTFESDPIVASGKLCLFQLKFSLNFLI